MSYLPLQLCSYKDTSLTHAPGNRPTAWDCH